MVTIGNDVVARYLFQRREDYTIIGSSKGMVVPKGRSYSVNTECNMSGQNLTANFLTNVCVEGDVPFGDMATLRKKRGDGGVSMGTSDGSESSRESSDETVEGVNPSFEGGVIRLGDEHEVASVAPRTALVIVEPQPTPRAAPLLEYLRKGKEKVVNEEIEEKKGRNGYDRVRPLNRILTSLILFQLQTQLKNVLITINFTDFPLLLAVNVYC
ncbi:unnamed protein product [Eruca vesicaria subsp. sativa]|uniref:Uncharacterized protein n=1 Tax=Eruca vesicaria subsp. sativa TaxID=29727 RepID=A0ABC8L8U0_ERUVS|nr:unnamed protein product [Eruca vesicaria subsp. sativa]